ncbi:MAG: hypothetical protein DLM69_09575 [Candidatus Chloroheliales bacterium]|nr:MAG: hypothetical protein DLM69_09575 [Chloroflexota bacterium]
MSGTTGSTVQQSAVITLAAGTSNRVFIACSGGVLTGGGFSKDLGINVTTAAPARDGWLVAGTNHSTANQKLTAYVICLQGTNLNASTVSQSGSAKAGGIANTMVGCPDGTLISGGGFDTAAGVNVYSSASHDNGWQIYGINLTSATQQLNAYAICVTPLV